MCSDADSSLHLVVIHCSEAVHANFLECVAVSRLAVLHAIVVHDAVIRIHSKHRVGDAFVTHRTRTLCSDVH